MKYSLLVTWNIVVIFVVCSLDVQEPVFVSGTKKSSFLPIPKIDRPRCWYVDCVVHICLGLYFHAASIHIWHKFRYYITLVAVACSLLLWQALACCRLDAIIKKRTMERQVHTGMWQCATFTFENWCECTVLNIQESGERAVQIDWRAKQASR